VKHARSLVQVIAAAMETLSYHAAHPCP
jgi:hypothetical protein